MSDDKKKTNFEIPIPPKADVPVSVASGLVSILMPCCGQLEFTKLCIRSVLRYSRDPFELIFVDVGSLDGTAEYLAGIADASGVRVEVVRTLTDQGITEAVEKALALSHGQFVVLLNSDTVVSQGWVNQLTMLASASAAIGMVGPMSNYAAPPQLVENVPYRVGPKKGGKGQTKSLPDNFLVDVSAVDTFARKFFEENKGKWMEVERLGGFCLLFKREMLKKIESTSVLREWTDLRIFDTDILSAKARQAGYTLACARDLYIHHFGSRIFAHGAPAVVGK
jgi:GT2 family glycosyltransferase